PREDLDDPTDLAIPPDHRIELSCPGVSDQVSAVFLQRLVRDLGHGGRHPLTAPDRRQGLQESLARQPVLAQAPSGSGLGSLSQKSNDEVLNGDVLVLQPCGFPLRRIEETGQPLGNEDLTGGGARPAPPRPLPEGGFDVGPQPEGAASERARPAGRAAQAGDAPRRPRCAQSAAPWSARRAALPETSG